jgi:hypothetical protein
MSRSIEDHNQTRAGIEELSQKRQALPDQRNQVLLN